MRNKRKINDALSVLLTLSLAFALPGCGRKEAEKYGQDISDYTLTKVDTILKEAANFDGKTVTIKGKITRECPTGCWFNLKDQEAEIYVDLNPSAFAIPQKTGKKVVVEGKVAVRNNQPIIIGTGVEIK